MRGWFLSSNIKNVVCPNLNFLRDECGIPEERVSLLLKRHPSFFVQKPDSLRALADRVEGIGISRGSEMFLWILDVLHRISREKSEARVKLMNTFGWSNSDFVAAIKKQPTFFMAFRRGLSLEKRLIPRFHVMEIMKSEGLWTSQDKRRTFFLSPGSRFLQKYVLPYKDKLPKPLEVVSRGIIQTANECQEDLFGYVFYDLISDDIEPILSYGVLAIIIFYIMNVTVMVNMRMLVF